MANQRYKFKTTNIKGKDYVEVNQRILFFRNDPAYAGWSLTSEILEHDKGAIIIRATISDSNGNRVASGIAREIDGDSFINKTSYVENCETSAWGRALANMGIGIETSIASSNEVQNAILQQETRAKKKVLTEAVYDRMLAAIADGNGKLVEESLETFEDSDLKDLIKKEING